MHELLSRVANLNASLLGQEFYELNLYDSVREGRRIYCVSEASAQWSDMDGQIMWDRTLVHSFPTLQEAKEKYAGLKLDLAKKGFKYSDMD
jgi:hypothetical protein